MADAPGARGDLSRLTRACNDALDAISSMNSSEVRSIGVGFGSSSLSTSVSSVGNEIARCFPSQRQHGSGRRRPRPQTEPASRSGPNPSKRGRPSSTIVHKDLVIIPDPETSVVPTHSSRIKLEKRGLVVHEFPFNRSWSPVELRLAIRKQLPKQDMLFEFVKSCYGELVKPKLAPGVGMSAEVLMKLTGQGCVYVRALEPTTDSNEEESDDGNDYKNDNAGDQEFEIGVFTTNSASVSRSHAVSSESCTITRASTPAMASTSTTNLTNSVLRSQNMPVIESNAAGQIEHASSESSTIIRASTPAMASTSTNLTNSVLSSQNIPVIETNAAGQIDTVNFNLEHTDERSHGPPTISLVVHRSNVKGDMLNAFKDPSIMPCSLNATIIDNRGMEELGTGSGVLREVFSLFWKDAYDSFMVGVDQRVPYIRHDYNRQKWEAVGRILVKGFNECSYFPMKLSKSFFAAAVFGEQRIPFSMHLESFLHYVSEDEAEIIKKCMSHEMESGNKELTELLSNFDCKRLVKDDNIMDVISELAHKELVQKPQYVVDCWNNIIAPLRLIFPSIESIEIFYSTVTPTTTKVISMLESSPSNPSEQECLSHLKRYIRGLNSDQLSKFLRFTTGAEILVTDVLHVTFFVAEGLQRRPIAHTCGFTLELPSTYDSFCDLREEFSAVLGYGNWTFDIQ